MDRETVFKKWLDIVQNHHEKLNRDRKNIIDSLYIDAMKQMRAFIKMKGWNNTMEHISNWIEEATGTNMVGSHHLRNCYIMILDKMISLDNKQDHKLQKEFDKLHERKETE